MTTETISLFPYTMSYKERHLKLIEFLLNHEGWKITTTIIFDDECLEEYVEATQP